MEDRNSTTDVITAQLSPDLLRRHLKNDLKVRAKITEIVSPAKRTSGKPLRDGSKL